MTSDITSHKAIQFETNIDDMDPRLWPNVIDALLAAGARDAWATPIVMKKGRPAFTLSVLCTAEVAGAVLTTIFQETTTIGVRELPIRRHALARTMTAVNVQGEQIGVKVARLNGEVINRSVEWDDVVAAAKKLNMAPNDVLTLATQAAGDAD